MDTGTLEKPAFTSGRLSRIGMISDEEEFDVFSDDELSIDVPMGSVTDLNATNKPTESPSDVNINIESSCEKSHDTIMTRDQGSPVSRTSQYSSNPLDSCSHQIKAFNNLTNNFENESICSFNKSYTGHSIDGLKENIDTDSVSKSKNKTNHHEFGTKKPVDEINDTTNTDKLSYQLTSGTKEEYTPKDVDNASTTNHQEMKKDPRSIIAKDDNPTESHKLSSTKVKASLKRQTEGRSAFYTCTNTIINGELELQNLVMRSASEDYLPKSFVESVSESKKMDTIWKHTPRCDSRSSRQSMKVAHQSLQNSPLHTSLPVERNRQEEENSNNVVKQDNTNKDSRSDECDERTLEYNDSTEKSDSSCESFESSSADWEELSVDGEILKALVEANSSTELQVGRDMTIEIKKIEDNREIDSDSDSSEEIEEDDENDYDDECDKDVDDDEEKEDGDDDDDNDGDENKEDVNSDTDDVGDDENNGNVNSDADDVGDDVAKIDSSEISVEKNILVFSNQTVSGKAVSLKSINTSQEVTTLDNQHTLYNEKMDMLSEHSNKSKTDNAVSSDTITHSNKSANSQETLNTKYATKTVDDANGTKGSVVRTDQQHSDKNVARSIEQQSANITQRHNERDKGDARNTIAKESLSDIKAQHAPRYHKYQERERHPSASTSSDYYDKSKQCRKLNLPTRQRRRLLAKERTESEGNLSNECAVVETSARYKQSPFTLYKRKQQFLKTLGQTKEHKLNCESIETNISELKLVTKDVTNKINRKVDTKEPTSIKLHPLCNKTPKSVREESEMPTDNNASTPEVNNHSGNQIESTRERSIINTARERRAPDTDSLQNTRGAMNISNNHEIDNAVYKGIKAVEIRRLLPEVNGKGNWDIKLPSQCKVVNRHISNNCESAPLSLRQNYQKNNKTNESKYPINKQSTKCQKNLETKTKTSLVGQSPKRMQHANTVECSNPSNHQQREKRLIVDEMTGKLECCQKLDQGSEDVENNVISKDKDVSSGEGDTYSKDIGVKNSDLEIKNVTDKTVPVKVSALLNRSRGNTKIKPNFPATLIRNEPPLTDTARLHKIRQLLRLPDVPGSSSDSTYSSAKSSEACAIVQDIIHEVLTDVQRQCKKVNQPVSTVKRCTSVDDNGDEILCCLLQTTSVLSEFKCDVISPLDVAPVTKQYEHLVSSIIRVTSEDIWREGSAFRESVLASLPIAHWYVEPWQELVLRHTNKYGNWRDGEEAVDILKIDDTTKAYYGIQVCLTEACYVAVVTRPKVTTVTLATHDKVTHAWSDNRVKMYTSSSNMEKDISMQVVPVDVSTIEGFQTSVKDQSACRIVASSPLVQMTASDHEPESLAFEVPYVTFSSGRDIRTPISRSVTPVHKARDTGTSFLNSGTPYLKPTSTLSPRSPSTKSPFVRDANQTALHLVHITKEGAVKIKLLEMKTDDKVANSNQKQVDRNVAEESEEEDKSVKFTVYDHNARLIVVETRGSLLYKDVQKVTQSFVNYVIKHRVKLCMFQDPRNVYSILLTASIEQPHRQGVHLSTTRAPPVEKEIQLDEGEVIAIVFRGNVEVPDCNKLMFSFHGYLGFKRHFDIEVSNPLSQRSLQTYHGALQIYTFKKPRTGAIDRSQFPSVKNGWELTAEFPFLLPKYLKSTPVIVNKAPVSIKFQEPLTVDFVRLLCNELLPDWIKFAKALGMSHARIQAIKQQHRNVVSDRVLMDVLVSWLKTRTISQDKVMPVVEALYQCNNTKLASELEQRLTAIKTTKSKAVKERNLQRAFSLIGKSTGVVGRWRHIFHDLLQSDDSSIVDVTREIEQKNDDDVTKCNTALYHWKTNSKAPSIWTLVDALRSSHCTVVADTIVAMETRTEKQ